MMIKNLRFFVTLFTGFLLLACQPESREVPERLMDPWAFRSVLDRKPRMLSLALDSACYAAYDLAKGQLYKVWKGGILMEGTVFTNKKNIQPASWGEAYYKEGDMPEEWVVSKNGQEIPFELRTAIQRIFT